MRFERIREGSYLGGGRIAGTSNAYADFGHHIELLTIQRDNIAESMAHATALEAELERLQKAMEEQVDLLTQDFV